MMKFAVTGGIAAGKTLVAEMLREQGILLLDADSMALDFITNSVSIRERITAAFGRESFTTAGQLNRSWLASRVFDDSASLARYNAIYEPEWLQHLRTALEATEQQGTIGLDAALVAEWGIADWFDLVILVTAPAAQRVARLQQDRNLSLEEAQRRIEAQLGDHERRLIATEVIVNDRGLEEMRDAVKRLAHKIKGAATGV